MINKLLLTILSLVCSLSLTAQTITTFAGDGSTVESPDGTNVATAGIGTPFLGAMDRFNNYFFYANYKIRKISEAGIISTITNSATSGSTFSGDGGPSSLAGISPSAFAPDHDGNLYICDYDNNRIRRVDAGTGIITTIAGTGVGRTPAGPSGDGGLATAAVLLHPNAIAFDHLGNIYISDLYSVRRIDPSGIISTVVGQFSIQGYAGDGGPATAAVIGLVYAIAFDSHNNCYFYTHHDSFENEIRKVDAATGIISTVAGGGTASMTEGAAATSVKIGTGSGAIVVTEADEILFAIASVSRVFRIDASGIISIACGNGITGYCGDGGPATAACMDNILGIALDKCNDLYIADLSNNRIRKVDFLMPCPPAAVTPVHTQPSGLSLSPNPATGSVNVSFENIKTLTITSIIGKTMFAATLPGCSNTEVDISRFPSGLYYITVNGSISARLLKQ